MIPNQPFATQVSRSGAKAIKAAVRLIGEGLPVAIPTETVYGLAADATSAQAVDRIYRAKGRPDFNPLIVHVRDLAHAEEFGMFEPAARAAALAFWPGALTLVVNQRAGSEIARNATAGLATIALRCPDHPLMQALLAGCGKPLAAPSANASGAISPTSAEHVLKSLNGRIPLIVDGGEAPLGLESTIVAMSRGEIRLLRPGPLDFARVAAVAGLLPTAPTPATIEAPGQMRSHYAPSKPIRLGAVRAHPGEWLIGFGAVAGDDTLSASGDLTEAAARLFSALHRADASTSAAIAVALVPETGPGAAINDRLRRAAAPR